VKANWLPFSYSFVRVHYFTCIQAERWNDHTWLVFNEAALHQSMLGSGSSCAECQCVCVVWKYTVHVYFGNKVLRWVFQWVAWLDNSKSNWKLVSIENLLFQFPLHFRYEWSNRKKNRFNSFYFDSFS